MSVISYNSLNITDQLKNNISFLVIKLLDKLIKYIIKPQVMSAFGFESDISVCYKQQV